jgi:hypothetical protein
VIEAVFKDFLFFQSSGAELKHSEMLEKNQAVSTALSFIFSEIGQTSLGIPSLGIARKARRKRPRSCEQKNWKDGGASESPASPALLWSTGSLLLLTISLLG